MSNAAAKSRPFRHAVFTLAVRNHLTRALMAREGLTRAEAREQAQTIDDDVIEEAASQVAGVEGSKVGAGGVLDFILKFIQSPLFAQILELLLGLFSASPAAPAPPAPPAPPPA